MTWRSKLTKNGGKVLGVVNAMVKLTTIVQLLAKNCNAIET